MLKSLAEFSPLNQRNSVWGRANTMEEEFLIFFLHVYTNSFLPSTQGTVLVQVIMLGLLSTECK